MCLKVTIGDVGIALVSFDVAAVLDKQWIWFVDPSKKALAAYVATGVLITIAFEWHAVYWVGRWAYSDLMAFHAAASRLRARVAVGRAALAVHFFLRRHRPVTGAPWL